MSLFHDNYFESRHDLSSRGLSNNYDLGEIQTLFQNAPTPHKQYFMAFSSKEGTFSGVETILYLFMLIWNFYTLGPWDFQIRELEHKGLQNNKCNIPPLYYEIMSHFLHKK